MLVPHNELDAEDGIMEPFPMGRNGHVKNCARDSQETSNGLSPTQQVVNTYMNCILL